LKGLVLVTVCASLLLVGMISSQSFAASGHLYISQWKGFDTTEPDIDCLLWAEYCRTMYEGWKQPQQIAVDDERNIYVADTGNSRIQKFTSDGEFLSSWGLTVLKTENFNLLLALQFMKIMYMLLTKCRILFKNLITMETLF